MFYIGICDDEKGTCGELENMLYAFSKKQSINIEVSIWYTGESLCTFLKKETTLDMLFLDIELISTDGIKIGSFIREELENLEILNTIQKLRAAIPKFVLRIFYIFTARTKK